jgi:site-specific DNA recombinase
MDTKQHHPAEPRKKPVGIWVRVSTEDQAKGESPEHHEVRARMYAETKGWHVVRVYDLSGVSGKSVMGHAECHAMLDDVAAGRITALIFSKLARLARNTRELLDFAERFKDHGADLVSLQESIDTSTPAGRMFYTMIAAQAQWEREEIADRVRASVGVRAKLGKSVGGAAPFGYRWEGRRLALDEKEAPVRRLMFELFREHKRLRTVARLLNEAGHRTRNGAKFSNTTVRRLLTDPVAKGLRRANYTQSLGERKHWKPKPESEWVFTEAPTLVSEALWEECNAILSASAAGWKPAKKTTYLFSGLTYCQCGAKMYRPSNMTKYYCRTCKTKIPERDLERVFVEQLRGFFLDPEEIAARLAENDRVIEERRALLRSLDEDAAAVAREMDQVYRLYIDGQITPEGFGARYRPLEERHAALSREIPRLQGEIDALAISHLSAAEVIADARTLYARWDNFTPDERRTIVETVVERITIGESSVDIDLAYVPAPPPSSLELAYGEEEADPARTGANAPLSPQAVVKRVHDLTGSWRRRA